MGLAASQARYLCLTARNSDLIYEGQQISQQRMALTKATQEVAEKYNKAMNNTMMQAYTAEGGTQTLTYDVITNQDPFSGLGMRLVDSNGNVVVPGKYIEAASRDENGKESVFKFSDSADFISNYMPDDVAKEELLNKSMSEICEYYNKNYADAGVTATYRTKGDSNLVDDGERVLEDVKCKDPAYLQRMITSGEWKLQQKTSFDGKWEDITWQGKTSISEVYDTSDDAAAEAEYEADMKDLQARDKILELRLEQVQTEQNAVQKELDSIKQIISKNIEDSFKTFSS